METTILSCAAALILFLLGGLVRHDWTRIVRPRIVVEAHVVGHRSDYSDGEKVYAARLAFQVDGQTLEVTDQRLHARPRPPAGTKVQLYYPSGRPDLARIRRPLGTTVVYLVLLTFLGVIVLKLLGHLG